MNLALMASFTSPRIMEAFHQMFDIVDKNIKDMANELLRNTGTEFQQLGNGSVAAQLAACASENRYADINVSSASVAAGLPGDELDEMLRYIADDLRR
ncbi:hypothetical protein CANCADRAFT_1576 [Tortispora caseinolytica NRRL Y-17796]|uniref:Uncharacterized protein n=1 Tax=Tortispora caseinolytica NRRL Y-17796 TaxID=767744 RepID=A0A1E4TDJ6_9ASCO|nr:hypothetical protein CANCADRAFT_1576 [Tortispora caseinolytica NRRL Y-17796]